MRRTRVAMLSTAAACRESTTPIVIAETTPICLHVCCNQHAFRFTLAASHAISCNTSKTFDTTFYHDQECPCHHSSFIFIVNFPSGLHTPVAIRFVQFRSFDRMSGISYGVDITCGLPGVDIERGGPVLIWLGKIASMFNYWRRLIGYFKDWNIVMD